MFSPSKQIRGLIDCDSFFASCEVALRPELVGRPVCIGGDIIIAATYDIKGLGIKVGTPVREAKKIVPENTVFLKPRMQKYQKISNRLMDYLRSKCLQVQVFSVDEAFVDITGYDKVFAMSYEKMLPLLQRDIYKKIGIPVSIGLAPTKLLAKMFADIRKPYGTYIALDSKSIDKTLGSLPLKEVPFIGCKTQEKLTHKCVTALDFKNLSYETVRKELGKSGLKLRFELNESHALTLGRGEKRPKGIGRSRSFNPRFTNQKDEIWSHLYKNINRALEELIFQRLSTSCIHIHFRDKGFKRFGTHVLLPNPLHDRFKIIAHCRELFEKMPFNEQLFYRSTGVNFTDITDGHFTQLGLFASKGTNKELLNKKIVELKKKFGDKIIL